MFVAENVLLLLVISLTAKPSIYSFIFRVVSLVLETHRMNYGVVRDKFLSTSIYPWIACTDSWHFKSPFGYWNICTSSSTTPASCRYSHWHPPYVTITHSMRGSRRDTLIFIGGKSQHETTVETQTEKRYWHWRISQSQSWTRLWILITKYTYIQKRFSCSICIVSTTQWRLGLRFSHCPLEALRAKLSHLLEWRHLLTVKLPSAAQNSVLWCSKHGAQICNCVCALCAKRLLILLEQWTLSICMA